MSSNNSVRDSEYGETLPLHDIDSEEDNLEDLRSNRNHKAKCISITLLIICFIIMWSMVFRVGDGITASLHRMDPCTLAKYGCCEIYTECEFKSDHIDYEKKRIKPYEIRSSDNLYSNCPSLETLINKYNQHYGNMTTDCGPYGCCPGLNIGCDKTVRQSFRIGNNEEIESFLKSNSKIINLKIPKIDMRGSNCYNKSQLLYYIIRSYSLGYPVEDYLSLYIILGLIIIIMTLSACGNRR